MTCAPLAPLLDTFTLARPARAVVRLGAWAVALGADAGGWLSAMPAPSAFFHPRPDQEASGWVHLSTPNDGTLALETAPRLLWNAQYAGWERFGAARLLNFQVQIATSSTFSALVLHRSVRQMSFRVPRGILEPGRTYHWRVVA